MVLNPWSGFNHIITGVIMWVSFWYTFNILLRLHLSDSREPKRKRPVFPNCTMEHPIIHYYTFVFLYIFNPNLWTWYYYKWFSPLLLCSIAFVLILWKFFNCITTSSTPTEQFIRFYPCFCLLYLDFLHFGCQRHSCICLCADTFKVMLLGAISFTPTEWFIRFFP